MWDHIINTHQSELLSTKTKQSKKMLHNNKKNGQFTFTPNNIRTKFFKELIKYKNNYQQYLNYIYKDYIIHFIVYF